MINIETISGIINEGSSFALSVTFKDEAGTPVIPTKITWSLTDLDGTIINNRDQVEVETPDSSIDIVLNENDTLCLIEGSNKEHRVITVYCEYNSDLGNGLTMYKEGKLAIKNLLNAPFITPET
jgi:hypothetical protein